MLTVRELQKQREARARVNHETYKMLLHQVQDRLRLRADNRASDLLWQVPPLVPGRPVYTVSHAARYITDKLRRGGFDVAPAAAAADVHVLYISWRPVAPPSPPRRRKPRTPPAAAAAGAAEPRRGIAISVAEASRSLDRLKARLSM